MCGIVGYIGHKSARPVLIEGLKRLEYRGYDSAGVAVVEDGRLEVHRSRGRINDLQTALTEIRSKDWRITCAPHHNHQDTAAYEVATQLWFDQHLKNTFRWPRTPDTALNLDAEDGVPAFTVKPCSNA